MTAQRAYADSLVDILDAMAMARQFVQGMTYSEFTHDAKTVFAVIRALEVIGEAAKNIPPSVRANYPELPWRDIVGMCDLFPSLLWREFGRHLEDRA